MLPIASHANKQNMIIGANQDYFVPYPFRHDHGKKLTKAQQRMKQFTDQRRRDVSFKEGDWVLVKLWLRR